MRAVLSPKAVKARAKISEPMRSRIDGAITKLEQDPLQGDIKNLVGRDEKRCRVGDYRIIFSIVDGKIKIANIVPRGGVYKGR
jgi:mRNA-degrading endonuclease RelE of RelBE toxin-antitoxin system